MDNYCIDQPIFVLGKYAVLLYEPNPTFAWFKLKWKAGSARVRSNANSWIATTSKAMKDSFVAVKSKVSECGEFVAAIHNLNKDVLGLMRIASLLHVGLRLYGKAWPGDDPFVYVPP